MQYDCWSTTVESSLFGIISASYTNTEILESSLVGFGVNWLLHKISFHGIILFGHVTELDTLRLTEFLLTGPWSFQILALLIIIEKSCFLQNEMTILTKKINFFLHIKFAEFLLWNKLEGHILCKAIFVIHSYRHTRHLDGLGHEWANNPSQESRSIQHSPGIMNI